MDVQQWQCVAFLAAGLAIASALLNLYLVLVADFWRAWAVRYRDLWLGAARERDRERERDYEREFGRGPDTKGSCNGRLER